MIYILLYTKPIYHIYTQNRVFDGVHPYQLMFFVQLNKTEFFSYELTYVLRLLGVIWICTITQVFRYFCGKENSSVLQGYRSLGKINSEESLVLFLLKPGAYQFSILGLLKCLRPANLLSSIQTFAAPYESKEIFQGIYLFNKAWDNVVHKLMSFVMTNDISLDNWSSHSRNLFNIRLTDVFQDEVNLIYYTAVQTATFRQWEINSVSNFFKI